LAATEPTDIKPNPKIQDPRLRHLALRLHALGPKPLYHFLDELERGADLRESLETRAALPAELIRAYRGDEFTPPFVIDGGAP
jgi:hypothetical protein